VQLDLVVKVLRDLTFADIPSGRVSIFHLSHPRPIEWTAVLDHVNSVLPRALRRLSLEDWLSLLHSRFPSRTLTPAARKSVMDELPALHLLSYFDSTKPLINRPHTVEFGMPHLSIEKAMEASSTLGDKNIPQLGIEDVTQWLTYWEEQKFISLNKSKL
jgi:hypothetical protein